MQDMTRDGDNELEETGNDVPAVKNKQRRQDSERVDNEEEKS